MGLREAFILFSSVRDLTDKIYLNFTTEFFSDIHGECLSWTHKNANFHTDK